ncbi:MAG TPA: DinB family protein [Acidimicrobiales bacterium]|nr:DinB family protein [Acidimicrobiales bacterium]
MPIPASPTGRSDVTSTVLTLFGQLHDQIRGEITGLDDDGLNWSPGEGANTIATIVTHVLGAEAETLRCVAGVASVRDRDGEFVRGARPLPEILGELQRADELLRALRPEIGAHRLRSMPALPTLPDHERRSGLTWLVGNYGHAREHVGHIQLTKQLYRAASSAP